MAANLRRHPTCEIPGGGPFASNRRLTRVFLLLQDSICSLSVASVAALQSAGSEERALRAVCPPEPPAGIEAEFCERESKDGSEGAAPGDPEGGQRPHARREAPEPEGEAHAEVHAEAQPGAEVPAPLLSRPSQCAGDTLSPCVCAELLRDPASILTHVRIDRGIDGGLGLGFTYGLTPNPPASPHACVYSLSIGYIDR